MKVKKVVRHQNGEHWSCHFEIKVVNDKTVWEGGKHLALTQNRLSKVVLNDPQSQHLKYTLKNY